MNRWAGTGTSAAVDSRSAGAQAVDAALDGRDDAKLVVVFASEQHDLQELIDSVNAGSGGVPLIGCSTAGEIASTGPTDAGVSVFALGGPGFVVKTTISRQVSADLRESGRELARSLAGEDRRPHKVLMLLTDALAGDQQAILRGVYSVYGASIPLVGGCAGDDLQMQATYQFFNGSVYSDSIVAAHISSDAPIGIGVRHGWRPVGSPMLVTHSSGNIVWELDGRPALDVYLERLEAPDEAGTRPSTFTRFALNHPLGLAHRGGEAHVRFIAEADFDRRGIVCLANVTEGSSVWVMEGDEASVIAATTAACDDALSALEGQPAIGALAFDCIARRSVLGETGIGREVALLSDRLDGAPLAGFYTYGEIARTEGVEGFHNETLVVMALA